MGKLEFTKMQGAGNDYIYVDCMRSCPGNLAELSRRLCDRHTSVGADGLVLILPSETADFRMRMFNADGSEGLMCGNAARCVGKYVYEKGLTARTVVRLETLSGVKCLDLHLSGGKAERVTVDMGIPVMEASRIPVVAKSSGNINVSTSYGEITLAAVSMGNPHGVVFCSLQSVDVAGLGRELECHPVFPERANVGFAEVVSFRELNLRVWERGSGETRSCGTGACAAVVAGVLGGRCGRRVSVRQPGGVLDVDWQEADGRVYLSGPAEFSFEGTIEI